jgi:hypothetical protein
MGAAQVTVTYETGSTSYDLRFYGSEEFTVPAWWIGMFDATRELRRTEVPTRPLWTSFDGWSRSPDPRWLVAWSDWPWRQQWRSDSDVRVPPPDGQASHPPARSPVHPDHNALSPFGSMPVWSCAFPPGRSRSLCIRPG